jgi:hypothetical protein
MMPTALRMMPTAWGAIAERAADLIAGGPVLPPTDLLADPAPVLPSADQS